MPPISEDFRSPSAPPTMTPRKGGFSEAESQIGADEERLLSLPSVPTGMVGDGTESGMEKEKGRRG